MKKKNTEFDLRKSKAMATLSGMPPMSHWPDRKEKFDYTKSDVCRWLMEQEDLWSWIFRKAMDMGAIVFNPQTKMWVGTQTAEGIRLVAEKAAQDAQKNSQPKGYEILKDPNLQSRIVEFLATQKFPQHRDVFCYEVERYFNCDTEIRYDLIVKHMRGKHLSMPDGENWERIQS